MSLKKHILILPQWYPNQFDPQLGGFIEQQANLVKEDYAITVLYVHQVNSSQPLPEHRDSSVKGFREIIRYFKGKEGKLSGFTNFKNFRKQQNIGLALLQKQIDLCHVQVPFRVGALALELHKKGVPVVLSDHWSGHLNNAWNDLPVIDRSTFKKLHKISKITTVVSKKLQKAIENHVGIQPEIIPNIIYGKLHPKRSESEKIKFLSVGDIYDKTKNYSGIIRSFAKAIQTNPKIELTIIGDGPDAYKIKELSREILPLNSIHFLGRLSQGEVQNKFREFDYFINFSTTETFGMAIAEAIANGIPVIASRCGGPEEFINAKNGLLISPQDEAALTKAIHTITELNFDRMKMHDDILSKYGEEAVRESWLSFYTKALA